ncbi:MAG: hypothetical protein DRQ14_02605 [Candidatus Latescibacterota bacterium]|nr:MAG: hypothetical protein DRQ14_02605 [Candidatus Latescibacterota bacterium]
MSPLRLFDANAMVGRWPTEKLAFHDLEGMLTTMDRLGIDEALVWHSLSRFYDPMEGNRKLMEEIGDHPRLHPCWVLVPPFTSDAGTVEEVMADMRKNGVRAVKFFPREHGFKLRSWNMGGLLEALERERVPVLLDADQVDPEEVHELCEAYPRLPVVLGRTGYREMRAIYALLAGHENFYVDISTFLLYRGLEEVVGKFGAGRLIFGTGMPIHDPAGAATKLRYAEVDDEAKEMIAHRNLEGLLERVGT